MTSPHPIRFIMLGGFLGAGKTTALLRLARTFTERGQRVGIITNDQAEGLVDTLTFRAAGYNTEEIPAGCFCCHFEKLLEASGRLADGLEPDIILAEPVGSCTDLVNAVITPLKNLYRDRFDVAPYAALLDPLRAQEALDARGPLGFSKKVTYLFKMQQNEADIIAVNKSDTLDGAARKSVGALVAQNFPSATCVFVSARTGEGFEELMPLLDAQVEAGVNPARVDYEQYTEGEIALGWLNARIALEATQPWDGNGALATLADQVRAALIGSAVEIAHFKMRLIATSGDEAALHTTRNDAEPMITDRLSEELLRGTLVVNIRAEGAPGPLEAAVRAGLVETGTRFSLKWHVERCDAFTPDPPSPPPPERNVFRP